MIRLIISLLICVPLASLDESAHAQDNLPLGIVKTPDGVAVVVINKNGKQITIQASETSVQLPVGKYQIDEWTMERTNKDGNNWKITGNNLGKKRIFKVIQGQEIKLLVGEPLISSLTVSKSNSTYQLVYNLRGQLSETIEITKNGSRPDAPKLKITNADDSYQETLTFQYG